MGMAFQIWGFRQGLVSAGRDQGALKPMVDPQVQLLIRCTPCPNIASGAKRGWMSRTLCDMLNYANQPGRGLPAIVAQEEDVEAHAGRQRGWSIPAITPRLDSDRKPVRACLRRDRAA
jgi:hypothetical protein